VELAEVFVGINIDVLEDEVGKKELVYPGVELVWAPAGYPYPSD